MNKLYFGDNLEVLRSHIAPESVDLVYLDPPFNSNANYNVLFGAHGRASEAQVEAFKDTWSWEDAARDAYQDLLERGGQPALLAKGLRPWLGETTMMAYVVMMAVRLIELERVLKPTGSLYLHCDPTASHYLKLVLDSVFGHRGFVSEIVWRRTNSRSTTGKWPRLHDTILQFAPEPSFLHFPIKTKADSTKLPHTLITGSDGLKYQTYELTGPGRSNGETGRPWRGFDPSKMGRHWGNSHSVMDDWADDGLIHFPPNNGFPRRRDAVPFDASAREVTIGDVWTDIDRLNQTAKERLGYPTQKPVALLERIIMASTPENGVVLDPFCGCGTTIEAAKNLGRQWIGIDVTHYAVTLIEKRLARSGVGASDYKVSGRPTDLAGARDLAARDKYQFQWWAAWSLGAQTYREEKKGADRGVDGNIFFANGPYGTGRIIISVKGGENVGVGMVRDLRGVIEREDAEMGILITLAEPTSAMITEAAAAGVVRKSAHGRLPRIQIATIADILDGRLPKLPPLPVLPRQTSPQRKRRKSDQIEMLLPLDGLNIKPSKGEFLDPRFMKMA